MFQIEKDRFTFAISFEGEFVVITTVARKQGSDRLTPFIRQNLEFLANYRIRRSDTRNKFTLLKTYFENKGWNVILPEPQLENVIIDWAKLGCEIL